MQIDHVDDDEQSVVDRSYGDWLIWGLGLAALNWLGHKGPLGDIDNLPFPYLTGIFAARVWWNHPTQRLTFDARSGLMVWLTWHVLLPWRRCYAIADTRGLERRTWVGAEDDTHHNLGLRIGERTKRLHCSASTGLHVAHKDADFARTVNTWLRRARCLRMWEAQG